MEYAVFGLISLLIGLLCLVSTIIVAIVLIVIVIRKRRLKSILITTGSLFLVTIVAFSTMIVLAVKEQSVDTVSEDLSTDSETSSNKNDSRNLENSNEKGTDTSISEVGNSKFEKIS